MTLDPYPASPWSYGEFLDWLWKLLPYPRAKASGLEPVYATVLYRVPGGAVVRVEALPGGLPPPLAPVAVPARDGFRPSPGERVVLTSDGGELLRLVGNTPRVTEAPPSPTGTPFVPAVLVPPFAWKPREVSFATNALQTFEATSNPKYQASGTISYTVAPGTGGWNRLSGYKDVNGLVQPTSDAMKGDGTLAKNSADYTPTAALSAALMTRTVPTAWMPFASGLDGSGKFVRAVKFTMAHLEGEPGNWPAALQWDVFVFPTDGAGSFYDGYLSAYPRWTEISDGSHDRHYGWTTDFLPEAEAQSTNDITPATTALGSAPWGKFRPDGSFTPEGSLGEWEATYAVPGASGILPAKTYLGKVLHPDWPYQGGIVSPILWTWEPSQVAGADPGTDGILTVRVQRPQPVLIGLASDFSTHAIDDPNSYAAVTNPYYHILEPYSPDFQNPSAWEQGHSALFTGTSFTFFTTTPPQWAAVGGYDDSLVTSGYAAVWASVPAAGVVHHRWIEDPSDTREVKRRIGWTIYWWPGAGTIRAFEPAWHPSQYGYYVDGTKNPARCRMSELDSYYGTVPLNLYTGEHGTLPTPYSGLAGAWCGISFTASGRYNATALVNGASLIGLLLLEDGTLSVSVDGTPAWSGALSLLQGDAGSDTPQWVENGPEWLHSDWPEAFARVGNCILRPLAAGDKAGKAYSSSLLTPPPVVIALVES